jgi:hypothetical protein
MRYLNPQTEWGIVVRNTFMRVATFLMLDYLAKVGATWLGFTEKELVVPQYEWPAASVHCTLGYRGVVTVEDKGRLRLLQLLSLKVDCLTHKRSSFL